MNEKDWINRVKAEALIEPLESRRDALANLYIEYMRGDRVKQWVSREDASGTVDFIGERIKAEYATMGLDAVAEIRKMIEKKLGGYANETQRAAVARDLADSLKVFTFRYYSDSEMSFLDDKAIDFQLGNWLKPFARDLSLAAQIGELSDEDAIAIASLPKWLWSRQDYVGIIDAFFEELLLSNAINRKPSDKALASIFTFADPEGAPIIDGKNIRTVRSQLKSPTDPHQLSAEGLNFVREHVNPSETNPDNVFCK